MKKVLIGALVGLAAGLPGGWFGNAHFAEGLGLDGDEVEAVVLEERSEGERLVLMLQAEEETMLATFTERPEDVARLVAPGDTVTLFVRADSPFADDVPILSVRRGERAEGGSDEPEPDDASAEPEPEEAATEDEADGEADPEAGGEPAAEDAAAGAEEEAAREGEGAEGATPLLTRGRT